MERYHSQLPLHNQRSRPHNLLLRIQYHQNVISTSIGSRRTCHCRALHITRTTLHFIESLLKLLLSDVSHLRQNSEHIEEALFEVGSFERADGVVFGESGEHLGRNEGGGEEGIGSGGIAVRSGRHCGRVRVLRSWCLCLLL